MNASFRNGRMRPGEPGPGCGRVPRPLHAIAVTACLAALSGGTARAQHADADHEAHAAHGRMADEPRASIVDIAMPDAELVTQDGETVRLASDVVADNIVVMDFVYTTCTTVCPVLSAIFGQVQERVGDRLGDDVALVSISVDPVRDTPARLKAYSERHRARRGWTWLTGSKPTVDDVLRQLGAYTANFEDHPSMVLVGDGRTGEWVRLLGFPAAERIAAKVEELRARRMAARATHSVEDAR